MYNWYKWIYKDNLYLRIIIDYKNFMFFGGIKVWINAVKVCSQIGTDCELNTITVNDTGRF